MKKIPALCFFISVVLLGERLMAQDFKLSGTFNTGILVTIPEEGETNVRLENDDGYGPASARLRLYGTVEKSYWGFKFRLTTDMNTDYQYVFLENDQFAYAWAAFFQDRMRIYAGKLAWGLWCTPFEKAWSLDALTGIRFEIKPVEGLNFGATFKVPPADMPDLGKYTLERMLNETVVGARWNARFFSLTGAFAFDGWDNFRNDEQAAIFGFEFRGIPNLWTGIESRFQYIGSGEMEYNLVERFGYPINVLTYSMLRLYQDGKIGTEGIDFRINPEANMHITGRLLVSLEAELAANTANFADSYWIGIKPKALLKLRGGSNLTFYYYGRFVHDGYSAVNVSFEYYF